MAFFSTLLGVMHRNLVGSPLGRVFLVGEKVDGEELLPRVHPAGSLTPCRFFEVQCWLQVGLISRRRGFVP